MNRSVYIGTTVGIILNALLRIKRGRYIYSWQRIMRTSGEWFHLKSNEHSRISRMI